MLAQQVFFCSYFSPSPFNFPLPSSPSISPPHSPSLSGGLPLPQTQLGGLGERCELPQRVWAESGRQTHFDAF